MSKSMINFNSDYIREQLREKGVSAQSVSRSLGYSNSYMSYCFCTKTIRKTVLKSICTKYGLDYKTALSTKKAEPVAKIENDAPEKSMTDLLKSINTKLDKLVCLWEA